MDTIKGSITKAGLVKVETPDLAGPNHLSADDFLKAIQQGLGMEFDFQPIKPTHAIQENWADAEQEAGI